MPRKPKPAKVTRILEDRHESTRAYIGYMRRHRVELQDVLSEAGLLGPRKSASPQYYALGIWNDIASVGSEARNC